MTVLMMHGMAISRLAMDISATHLKELQRFAEVGRISAGLIHDMSGPLTAAILHLEQDEPQSLSSVRHARRSIRVLERYIEAARQQLRQQDHTTIFIPKNEVIQLRQVLSPLAQKRDIDLQFRLYGNCLLKGDPIKFQRIITNLAINSMDAYTDSDIARRFVRITVTNRRNLAIIRVRDWGSGIKPEQIPRLFEPFYTTKPINSYGGTGIGLYNVKRYIENDFGGTITVVSSPSQGSEFKVELPAANIQKRGG